jgi:hypothetical protein
MTGIAVSTPLQLRRSAGLVWIAVVAFVFAALAAGAFALGRSTDNNHSPSSTVHTVYLKSVPGNAVQACQVSRPC